MTNKEAVEIFSKVKELPCGWCYEGGDEFKQAIDLASKALKQVNLIKFNVHALEKLIQEAENDT